MDLKPPPSNVDPTTNFWTVYKKVADEHDSDLVLKYVGDLDTSLLFVSGPVPLARLGIPTAFFSRIRRVYSRRSPLPSSSKSFPSSNQTLSISQTFYSSEYYNRTPRSVGPIPWRQSLIYPSVSSELKPSSSPVCASHCSWRSSRCWESSGSYITPRSPRGGTSSIEGGNARSSLWDSRNGDFT